MKQVHRAGLIGSLAAGLVLAHAGDVKAEAAGPSARVTSNQTAAPIQGLIVAVNMDKRRLQVREQDGRIVTVPIAPSAKITREGRSSALTDLSVGQQINIQQQAQRDGNSMATAIDVLAGGAAPAGAVSDAGSSAANPGFKANGAAKDAAGAPPTSNTQ